MQMPTYQYQPVHLIKNSLGLRLVTILPGLFDDPVSCTLSYEELIIDPQDEATLSNYEALSYTWGDTSLPGNQILLDNVPLEVTSNLQEALQYLRYTKSPRTLWIDAICIDQKNIPERNEMVPMMKDIYQSARRVLIWLGPDLKLHPVGSQVLSEMKCNEGTVKAFTFLEALANAHQAFRSANDMEDSEAWETGFEFGEYREFLDACPILNISRQYGAPPAVCGQWYYLQELLDRSWFCRSWVIQEATVAREAVAVCGHHTAPWENFQSATLCLMIFVSWADNTIPDISGTVEQLFAFSQLRSYYRDRQIGFGDALTRALYWTTGFQATDPHDKIYAIMGLIPDSKGRIVPDYGSPVRGLFQEVAYQILMSTDNLLMLCYCEGRDVQATGGEYWTLRSWGEGVSLRSWVPIWVENSQINCGPKEPDALESDGMPDVDTFSIPSAAGLSKSQVTFSSDHETLFVDGYTFSTISTVTNMVPRLQIENYAAVYVQAGQLEMVEYVQDILGSWSALIHDPSSLCSRAYGNSKNIDVAFAYLLMNNNRMARHGFQGSENRRELYLNFMNYQPPTGEELNEEQMEALMEAKRFANLVYDHLRFCCFFITSSGHIGLLVASHGADVGDTISILLGGPMPFILRQVDANHILVGRCWIQGLMRGEAMAELERDTSKLETFAIM